MLSIKSIQCGVAGLISIVACASLQAMPVAWSNASGTSTTFTWSNGANENNLANDPIANNGTFAFFPNLKAFSLSGMDATASEIIHVTLVPKAGQRISGVSADLFGDATVLGDGSAGYDATLDATKHGTVTHVSSSFMPPDINTQGAINDHFALNVPQGFGTVDLALDLNLHANGTLAFSEFKVVRLNVQTAPVNAVPLPAAVLTFPAGAAVAAFASRRMKKMKRA